MPLATMHVVAEVLVAEEVQRGVARALGRGWTPGRSRPVAVAGDRAARRGPTYVDVARSAATAGRTVSSGTVGAACPRCRVPLLRLRERRGLARARWSAGGGRVGGGLGGGRGLGVEVLLRGGLRGGRRGGGGDVRGRRVRGGGSGSGRGRRPWPRRARRRLRRGGARGVGRGGRPRRRLRPARPRRSARSPGRAAARRQRRCLAPRTTCSGCDNGRHTSMNPHKSFPSSTSVSMHSDPARLRSRPDHGSNGETSRTGPSRQSIDRLGLYASATGSEAPARAPAPAPRPATTAGPWPCGRARRPRRRRPDHRPDG